MEILAPSSGLHDRTTLPFWKLKKAERLNPGITGNPVNRVCAIVSEPCPSHHQKDLQEESELEKSEQDEFDESYYSVGFDESSVKEDGSEGIEDKESSEYVEQENSEEPRGRIRKKKVPII